MTSWDGPDTPDMDPLESGPSSIDQRIHVTAQAVRRKTPPNSSMPSRTCSRRSERFRRRERWEDRATEDTELGGRARSAFRLSYTACQVYRQDGFGRFHGRRDSTGETTHGHGPKPMTLDRNRRSVTSGSSSVNSVTGSISRLVRFPSHQPPTYSASTARHDQPDREAGAISTGSTAAAGPSLKRMSRIAQGSTAAIRPRCSTSFVVDVARQTQSTEGPRAPDQSRVKT